MCVCVCMGMPVPVSSENKLVSRSLGPAVSDVTQTDARRLSRGSWASTGTVVTSVFPTWCISKMTAMLLCPDGIQKGFIYPTVGTFIKLHMMSYLADVTVKDDTVARSIKKLDLGASAFP